MNYTALVQLPLDGKKYNVGFKLSGFSAAYAKRGPIDVATLAEKDKALLEKYTKANEEKRSDIEEEFELTPIVAGFIQSAYPDGTVSETKGTAIFDILTDEAYADLSLPSKLELKAESTAKDDKVSALEEELAALKAKLSDQKKK